MHNERRLHRRQLVFHLEVADARTHQPLGYRVDISPKGLRIVSDWHLDTLIDASQWPGARMTERAALDRGWRRGARWPRGALAEGGCAARP